MDEKNMKVIRTVRKLLALADKNKNSSQGEMENAALAAKRLLEKHDLSMFDVETGKFSEGIQETTKKTKFKNIPRGVNIFAMYIADCFDCKMFTNCSFTGDTIVFVGYETDVEVASYFFETLFPQLLNAATKEYKKVCVRRNDRERVIFRDSFLIGAGKAIKERLKKDEPVKSSTGTDIVVAKAKAVSNYLDRYSMRSTQSRRGIDGRGYGAGTSAGNNISLQRGVHGTSKGQLSIGS